MPDPTVQLVNLHKSFKTQGGVIHAVRGLSMTIPEGQRVALIGPNGAGKSTTIDMLLGLQTPDQGKVIINGEPPRTAIRRGRIGAMLQSGGLIGDLTVRELVDMVACLSPKSIPVSEALEIAHMGAHANKRASRLSGGESQRVRFAISLVSSPSLIVLDEPTAAMDVQGREDFWNTMSALESRGLTALFASHYLTEADLYADRVVVIAGGAIIADGTPAEIKRMAGGKRISATVQNTDITVYEALPGVTSATLQGGRLVLDTSDSDAALRALLLTDASATSIEVSPVGLDEAFRVITKESSVGKDEKA